MKINSIKKILKYLLIIFVLSIVFINIVQNNSFAGFVDNWEDPISNVKVDGDTGKTATGIMGTALYIVELLAIGIATIMLVVLGIKYMVSSANDRAEIKKHATIYVVGAIIIFGASGIVAIIRKFALDI